MALCRDVLLQLINSHNTDTAPQYDSHQVLHIGRKPYNPHKNPNPPSGQYRQQQWLRQNRPYISPTSGNNRTQRPREFNSLSVVHPEVPFWQRAEVMLLHSQGTHTPVPGQGFELTTGIQLRLEDFCCLSALWRLSFNFPLAFHSYNNHQ